ncbi:MAG TPA: prephenate dehydrogenase/arogenate dehydrogenase family protein [Methylophilaceae bacterium]|nr:prephenate dehydrogenase/arogenate dehydrogenase family protein [Methylophilaceae bacterium]HQR59944.1 prephenate dehydrogenase/arogenate dehydrogenase family protein [Methylophilaceae bacterium]
MTTARIFDKLAIFGVGLIGGSVALALKRAGQTGTIVGVGRHHDAMQEALHLGVIDQTASAAEAAKDADLILLATPVGQFPAILQTIAPHLKSTAVITDAGSTKGDVVAAARTNLGEFLPRFVPAHPIAGAEKSGVLAAKAELFDSKKVVLTPLPETDPDATAKAEAFWRACGARVSDMTVETHDRIFAAVSHLPHVLAFALVEDIACRPNADQLFGFAAGGFRDFSRIAGSSPEMWRDICLANRDAMLQELDAYATQLAQIRSLIDSNDGVELAKLFEHARNARSAWADAQQKQKK